MIIVPTKKSFPLFTKFPISTSTSSSTDRSFFSWHANYFTMDHKKILVLVNDLSNSPVVLANINSKNKHLLPEYIKEGIEHIFSYSTDKSYQIKKYFLKAGRMEISYSYNRSVLGVSTNMIQLLKNYPENLNLTTRLQISEMEFLAKTPFRSSIAEYSFSTEIAKKELDKL